MRVTETETRPEQQTMRAKTQIRHDAQDALIEFARNAFCELADGRTEYGTEGPEYEAYLAELERQHKRIRKLFGYEV